MSTKDDTAIVVLRKRPFCELRLEAKKLGIRAGGSGVTKESLILQIAASNKTPEQKLPAQLTNEIKDDTGWMFVWSDYGHGEEEVCKYYRHRENAVLGAIDFLSKYELFSLIEPKDAVHEFKRMISASYVGNGEIHAQEEDFFGDMDMRIEIKRILYEDTK